MDPKTCLRATSLSQSNVNHSLNKAQVLDMTNKETTKSVCNHTITHTHTCKKIALLRDTVHQTSRGLSAAAGLTAGQLSPLTPRGLYHVTAQFFLSCDVKNQNKI